MQPREALRQYFGHSDFRRGQRKLIEAVLGGRDVLGVMPTGGGKSMCYQIPALLPRRDDAGHLAAHLADEGSGRGAHGRGRPGGVYQQLALAARQLRDVYRRAYSGEYRLLYVAPERLGRAGFSCNAGADDLHPAHRRRRGALHLPVGAGFPSELSGDRRFHRRAPAAPRDGARSPRRRRREVQEDIVRLLEPARTRLREVTGFDRPNLYFEVQQPARQGRDAPRRLCASAAGRCGIVYCATRAAVERVCAAAAGRGHRRPRATTRDWTTRSGGAIRTTSCSTGRTVMVGDERLRHGHRQVQRQLRHPLQHAQEPRERTIRRPGAPGATASRRTASSCSPRRTWRRRAFSSTTAAATRSARRKPR